MSTSVNGIFTELLVEFSTPFSISYYCRTRKLNNFLRLRIPANSRSQLKTTGRKIEIIEINTDRQVLPAQKPLLRKFLRICQLFNFLWQRPQDQRPISLAFIWQPMDQIIRFFRIYSHVKHILHSTDTKYQCFELWLIVSTQLHDKCIRIFIDFATSLK